VGSLRVAYTKERQKEFDRMLAVCEKVVLLGRALSRAHTNVLIALQCASQAGLHVETLSPQAAQKMWPGMNFEKARYASMPAICVRVQAARSTRETCCEHRSILWCPTDGYLQPCDLAFSYQHQSRKLKGARFITNTWVEDIELSPEGTHVTAVKTNQGTIKCDTVINAAGAHAYHIAKVRTCTRLRLVPSLLLSSDQPCMYMYGHSLWASNCPSCL
jgi:glycine/D-amino acid oxidase-like deaminating enzyme